MQQCMMQGRYTLIACLPVLCYALNNCLCMIIIHAVSIQIGCLTAVRVSPFDVFSQYVSALKLQAKLFTVVDPLECKKVGQSSTLQAYIYARQQNRATVWHACNSYLQAQCTAANMLFARVEYAVRLLYQAVLSCTYQLMLFMLTWSRLPSHSRYRDVACSGSLGAVVWHYE